MKLNNPTSGILSDSMTSVLRALDRMLPGRTGRTLAASCAGISVSQVNVALRRLESIGVVRSEAVPPSKLYFLVPEHLLTGPLLELANAQRTYWSWLTKRLGGLPDLISASVFGSVARGEDSETSDLDLFLVYGALSPKQENNEIGLSAEFRLFTGSDLGITSRSRAELSNTVESSALVSNVLRDAVTVYGQDLRALLKETDHAGTSSEVIDPGQKVPSRSRATKK